MRRYEVFFPAGDLDWLGRDTPIATFEERQDMLHYVHFVHVTRSAPFGLCRGLTAYGPLEVKGGDGVHDPGVRENRQGLVPF